MQGKGFYMRVAACSTEHSWGTKKKGRAEAPPYSY